jgi:hypothetical protein
MQKCPTPSNRRGQVSRDASRQKTHLAQTHLHQTETTRYFPHQNVLVTRTQIKTLYKQQTPHLQTYTQTNLGLRNTTLGNRIHVQHRNTRTLPVEGSAHYNGRTMVCAEYCNTEGSPNHEISLYSYHYSKRLSMDPNEQILNL